MHIYVIVCTHRNYIYIFRHKWILERFGRKCRKRLEALSFFKALLFAAVGMTSVNDQIMSFYWTMTGGGAERLLRYWVIPKMCLERCGYHSLQPTVVTTAL
jgi:hypothetical protein